MKKNVLLSLLAVVILAFGLLYACDDSKGDGDDNPNDLTPCAQAAECPGGRLESVCFEGFCYEKNTFCESSNECVGECVDNVCEGGRLDQQVDGDEDTLEAEEEIEQEPESQICNYECCKDSDCPQEPWEQYCDPEEHVCKNVIDCPPEFECCEDEDCHDNPAYGEDYVCYQNECGHKDNPCNYECCTNEDCHNDPNFGADFDCIQHACVFNRIDCTPGEKQCCTDDPGNPQCQALGALLTEGILICNETGDEWELDMCPEFHDCFNWAGEIDCDTPNGRCEEDTDCECPQICMETGDGSLKCKVPMVEVGEVCSDDACGTGQFVQVGRCTSGNVCCTEVDQSGNPTGPGVCTPEADCGK